MPGRAGYEANFHLRGELWLIFYGEVIEQTGGARGPLSGRVGKIVSAVIAGVPGRVPDFMTVDSRSTASNLGWQPSGLSESEYRMLWARNPLMSFPLL